MPLSGATLRDALIGPDSWIRDVVVTASTASTNADLSAAAHAGAPEGTVHTTDLQTQGRGRLDRAWHAPSGSSIAVSTLLRPVSVPLTRWPMISLMAGLAVGHTLDELGVSARLKWPNDVLVGDCKIAGIKIDVVQTPDGPAAVVGVGLNTTLRDDELPVRTATSLLLVEAGTTDRHDVIQRFLRKFGMLYQAWEDDSSIVASYRLWCTTIGQRVKVELPGGETVTGMAEDVDDSGRLIVDGQAVATGEVIHVRPVS